MSFYVCVWAFFKLSQHFLSSYFSSSSKPLSSLWDYWEEKGPQSNCGQTSWQMRADLKCFIMVAGITLGLTVRSQTDKLTYFLPLGRWQKINWVTFCSSLLAELLVQGRAAALTSDSKGHNSQKGLGFFVLVFVCVFFLNIFLQHLAGGFVQNDLYPEILHQNVFQDYFNQIKQIKIDLPN